eukprot:1574085-Rhodomonas_salina.1
MVPGRSAEDVKLAEEVSPLWSYAMPGTDIAYGPTLLARYAICDTALAYGAPPSYAMSSTEPDFTCRAVLDVTCRTELDVTCRTEQAYGLSLIHISEPTRPRLI